jgi:translation initiation factor IF-2
MAEKKASVSLKVGKITHYYDKIGVAVLELSGNLATGDRIKFVRGGEDLFEQTVESMQVEHEKIDSAKKGQVVGLKVDQEVKEGAEVYKVS